MTSWNDDREKMQRRSLRFCLWGSVALLYVLVIAVGGSVLHGQNATPTPTPTLRMSATAGVLPDVATPTLAVFTLTPTPTPTLQSVTPSATPTLRATVTVLPLPTATRVPEKSCSLQIGGACLVLLPNLYRGVSSGEALQ